MGLNLRELLDTRVLIGGAYIMPPASAPDLLGDVLGVGTEICTNGRTPAEVADRILQSLTTPTG